MDLETLQQRIATGEDLHTEFKEWPIHADSLAAVLEMAPAEGRERTLLEAVVAWGRGKSEPQAVQLGF